MSASQGPSRLVIRPAERGDIPRIAASNLAMALETEGRRLDPGRLRAGVAAVFEDPSRGRYLVATRDGKPAGCLLLTREWSDWRRGEFWWIQSVYVTPEARRCGVFRALYEHVLREARATEGICGVRLYVDHENAGAREVYRRLGMTETDYRLYEIDFLRSGDSGGPAPADRPVSS